MKITLFTLIATASIGLADFVAGVNISNLNYEIANIVEVDIPIASVSFGYEFEDAIAPNLTIVPEFRLGTGITEDEVAGVDISVDHFFSFVLRGEYEVSSNLYLFANVAYTNAEASSSSPNPNLSGSDNDTRLGFGFGAGYDFSEKISLELATEFYDDAHTFGGGVRFHF